MQQRLDVPLLVHSLAGNGGHNLAERRIVKLHVEQFRRLRCRTEGGVGMRLRHVLAHPPRHNPHTHRCDRNDHRRVAHAANRETYMHTPRNTRTLDDTTVPAPDAMANRFLSELWSLQSAVFFLFTAAIHLLASLVEFGVLLVAFFYAWAGVLALGIYLVGLRWLFLQLIPLLIDLAGPIVLFVNVIITAWVSLEDIVIAIVDTTENIGDFIKNIGTAVDNVITGSHHHMADYVKYHFKHLDLVSEDDFTGPLKQIARDCTPIDSVASIADQWLPRLVDRGMCPVFRSLWPMPGGLGVALYEPWSGWVSDPTPFGVGAGNNCASTKTMPEYGVACACIAVGFPVLEVLLPCVFVGIFLLSSRRQLYVLLDWAVLVVWRAAWFVADTVGYTLLEIENVSAKACEAADSCI